MEVDGVPRYDGRVFISYSNDNLELAEHLAKFLEKNGIATWYAPRDIPAGATWDEAIISAIEHCKAVVLLFCAQADASRQVKREITLADRCKKPIFWVRIEKVEPVRLSYYLTSTQWFDWLDERDETLETLVHDLTSCETDTSVTAESTASKADDEVFAATAARADTEYAWAKGIFAFDTKREAAECAARVYFMYAQQEPYASVILPTGKSATDIFREMVRLARTEYDENPFGELSILSDTETFGVWAEHDTSRSKHIQDMLLTPLERLGKAPDESQVHLLSGVYIEGDPLKNAQKVIRLNPPVVHAVSLSPIGEILAYEVGTYNNIDDIVNDAPRIVEVGERSKQYIDPNQPSRSIVTIGLGTTLLTETLLILAFELPKANSLRRLFNGPITAGIPATLLRFHPNAYAVTTKRVAKEAGILEHVIDTMTPMQAASKIASHEA